VGDLVLVSAVIVHPPDLFMPAARADVIDLAFSNALNSATQAEDDFVRKPVGNETHSIGRGCVLVLLAKNLRGSDVLYVV
jgi:hypothetical protein